MNSVDVFILVILAIVFCLGTIIGSFLNVVILRAFSNESIVMPPSKCPKCGNRLKWWHNIPILSYILLRGKCYFCHEKISIQYPIIEFITGILFVLTFIVYGLQWETLYAFAVVAILIVLAVTDIKEKIVFDKHTYFLIALGLIYNLVFTIIGVWAQINTITGFHITSDWCLNNPMTVSVLGMTLGAVIMEVAARIGYLLAGNRAFGEGDTYIAAGLGAVFGWQNIIIILFFSLIIQLVLTFPIFVINQIKKKNFLAIISLIIFFCYSAGYCYADKKTTLFQNPYIAIVALLALVLIGIFACLSVLKGLKHKEDLTVLPFGPALVVAGIIVLLANFSYLA